MVVQSRIPEPHLHPIKTESEANLNQSGRNPDGIYRREVLRCEALEHLKTGGNQKICPKLEQNASTVSSARNRPIACCLNPFAYRLQLDCNLP